MYIITHSRTATRSQVVAVLRFDDPARWGLYTAKRTLVRRKGDVPVEERLTDKVISTPRRDDPDALTLEMDYTADRLGIRAPLIPEINEMFLWHGTKPDKLKLILANGVDERYCSLGCARAAAGPPLTVCARRRRLRYRPVTRTCSPVQWFVWRRRLLC